MGFEVRPALLGRRDFAQPVGEETQGTLGRYGGVQLTHSSRSGVTRVDKGFFAFHALGDFFALALIQGLEVIATHVDLAAHLQDRRCIGRQPQGDLPNSADVLRHIFTRFAISARGGLHQHTLLVAQVHGQAIELGFGHVLNRRSIFAQTQFTPHTSVEILCTAGFGVRLGANAQHGHCMAHAGERIQRFAAHTLGRGIRRDQFGVGIFNRLQLTKQPVVFGIGNLRLIQHVILMGMVVQSRAKLCHMSRIRPGELRRKQVWRGHGETGQQRLDQENKRRASADPADNSRSSSVLYMPCSSAANTSMASPARGTPLLSVTTPSMALASAWADSRMRS